MSLLLVYLFLLVHFYILLVLFCVIVCMVVCSFASVSFCATTSYVYLLLNMFRSSYSVSLCCSVYCLRLVCTVLLPPAVNPIAVKHFILYHKYELF